MKFKKTKTAALALSAVLAIGGVSGCSLVTTDLKEDLGQVVLEVNITGSDDFAEGGKFASYAPTIEETKVLKRDLVANFASYGSTYVNSYGYSAEDTYDLIMDSLVNRSIYLQYAKVYFFESDSEDYAQYTVDGYNAFVKAAENTADAEIAPFSYFLTQEERDAAEYSLKQMFNSTLDSQELSIIEQEADEHDHDTARTTPTGVDTANEDYYDPAYEIYTGSNSASNCGTYETVDGSTPSTRRQAYKALLSNLSYYGLVTKGENTSDITTLSYYALERRTEYESALINKMTEALEKEAAEKVTETWLKERIADTLTSQKEQFGATDTSAVESALDGASDTSFVFYAPEGFGYVINILLPFSTLQTQELEDSPSDLGDTQGNKFVKRASLLRGLTATDQRNTWFTGHDDFSFTAGSDAYVGAEGSGRQYLFFENNFTKAEGENAQYEPIPNYYGKYTYNGKVKAVEDEDGDTEYSFSPNKLTVDDFLSEMKSYLKFAGLTLSDVTTPASDYYTRSYESYYTKENGATVVDYSQFLYYEGKIDELASFNANKIFDSSSVENKALSVINELSFAYNTDTAGLNSYLGYAVSPYTTDFVKEFEYAAQKAVQDGPGTVTIAPSDYGWHVMYCTLAFTGSEDGVYTFDWNDIEKKGTFSNLYYEAIKADNFTSYSTDVRTQLINSFDTEACVTTYLNRYKDLWEG